MRFVRVAGLATVALTAVVAMGAAARARGAVPTHQQAPPDQRRTGGDGLFDAAAPLDFTLAADFGAIAKERGAEKHDHPGTLSYVTPTGDSVALDIRLHTRGHFRLRTCEFPPLKVVFDRQQTRHTLFAHQGGLKLVVQCRSSRSYANYLLEEYLIYKVYNLLTDRSLRARLSRVTYVDATGKHAAETRYGFFLEDDDRMARRSDAQVFTQKGVVQSETDFGQMGVLVVFQYMIGNTDWSVAGLHNIILIRDSTGVLFPVPYDFDWAGVISTPYARPDPILGIRYVRERLYRGLCRTPEELAAAFAPFNAQKEAIYALYRGQEALEPKRAQQALEYYDDFYRTINDPRMVKREFIQVCPRG